MARALLVVMGMKTPRGDDRLTPVGRVTRGALGSVIVKKLRCYLGLHRYERRRTDEGTWYKECRDCGKFVDVPAPLPPAAGL
jgi:hypothetical protein